MTTRVRFDITWTVTPEKMPFGVALPATLMEAITPLMTDSFSGYNPNLRSRVEASGQGDGSMDVRILWDVDLAAPGRYYADPEAHRDMLLRTLVGAFPKGACTLEVQVWRNVPFSEVVDHDDIWKESRGMAEKAEYPVYRPDPDADWPEADECFLMGGCWHWTHSPEARERLDEYHTIAVGPEPEAIFEFWDPEIHAAKAQTADNAAPEAFELPSWLPLVA